MLDNDWISVDTYMVWRRKRG